MTVQHTSSLVEMFQMQLISKNVATLRTFSVTLAIVMAQQNRNEDTFRSKSSFSLIFPKFSRTKLETRTNDNAV